MTQKLAARLVLHQDILRTLLGLPDAADVRHVELSATGEVHVVIHGAGLPVEEYGPAQVAVASIEAVPDYGHHVLRTIDWGFARRQLS